MPDMLIYLRPDWSMWSLSSIVIGRSGHTCQTMIGCFGQWAAMIAWFSYWATVIGWHGKSFCITIGRAARMIQTVTVWGCTPARTFRCGCYGYYCHHQWKPPDWRVVVSRVVPTDRGDYRSISSYALTPPVSSQTAQLSASTLLG